MTYEQIDESWDSVTEAIEETDRFPWDDKMSDEWTTELSCAYGSLIDSWTWRDNNQESIDRMCKSICAAWSTIARWIPVINNHYMDVIRGGWKQ